jgi:hypothetical protein
VKLAGGKGCFFEMVILAIKTVEGTCMIEDSQILVSVFRTFQIGIARIPTARAGRAYEFSHAIGWEWIMVIRKLSFVGPSSPYFSSLDMPYSTKACFAFRDLTPVETKGTGGTAFIMGRLYWKAVCPAAFGMNLFDLRSDF